MSKLESRIIFCVCFVVLGVILFFDFKPYHPRAITPATPTSAAPVAEETKTSLSVIGHVRTDSIIPKPVPTRDDTDNTHYSVESYPLASSTLYSYALQCIDEISPAPNKKQNAKYYTSLLSNLDDYRLVKNDGAVVIASLRTYTLADDNDCFGHSLFVFSKPTNSPYIYLWSYDIYDNDAFNSGLHELFRLDLAHLSVKPLASSTETLWADNYMGDFASSTIKLLSDGKRIIKWNSDSIMLINLDTDSVSPIYTVNNSDEWLISSMSANMNSNGASYDITFTSDSMIVGLYKSNESADGTPISVDKFGNVRDWGKNAIIQGKFVKNVTLPIPLP